MVRGGGDVEGGSVLLRGESAGVGTENHEKIAQLLFLSWSRELSLDILGDQVFRCCTLHFPAW